MALSIEKAYLLVTTDCDDVCRYCIVRKGQEHMDLSTIRQAIDLVFASHGQSKEVALYGGEPLVRYDLVEATAQAVADAALATGKRGRLFIYTNGYELDASRLLWLARNGVELIQSLDVSQQLGPPERRTPSHRTRFPVKVANLRAALDVLGPEHVCVCSVLLPDEVGTLMPQLRYIHEELGVRVAKILPGLGRYHWSEAQRAALTDELRRLGRYLVEAARTGRAHFFDQLNDSLRRATEKSRPDVLQVSVATFYPDRSFGLSPCEFELASGVANINDTSDYLLGSLEGADLAALERDVRRVRRLPRHSGLSLMSHWCEQAAAELVSLASGDERLRAYVAAARDLAFA